MKRILSLFVFLSSCTTTGVVLRETPLGISETRKAIVAVAGEPASTSQNGREIISKFTDRAGNPISEDAHTRYYSKFTINGDRRPYDIEVQVIREVKNSDFEFEQDFEDEKMAERLAEKLSKQLNQSRDKRNMIDDFRSF